MKKVTCLIFGTIALLLSCSKSLTDIGYSSSYPQPPYNPNSVYTNSEFRSFSPITGTYISPFYKSSERSYDLYTYITDNDIEDFYRSLVSQRMELLSNYYSQKNAQIKREITYEGDDWFRVSPAGTEKNTRIRVIFYGKKFEPQIADVENLSSAENDIKEYINSRYQANTVNNRYTKFLSNIVYRNCNEDSKGYVEEKDIIDFANKMVQQRTTLLHEFYSDLTSTAFNRKDFSKKYYNLLSKDVAKALKSSKNVTKQCLGEWTLFEPKDASNFRIAYDSDNWFKVYGKDSNTPDVIIQVVYCNNNMNPIITGLRNTSRNIYIEQEVVADKGSIPTGW